MQAHRSYVLRCLPVRCSTEERLTWRFSLQAAEREAERHAFSSLEDLVAFLRSELRSAGGEADAGERQ